MAERPSISEIQKLPAVERVREKRPPLVPYRRLGKVIALGSLAVLICGLVGWALVASMSVATPSLIGFDQAIAKSRAERSQVKIEITASQISAEPAGMVISQSPKPNASMIKGTSVSVVVSSGAEEFTLPNVLGDARLYATNFLTQRGLNVETVEQPSDGLPGLVLSSSPAPESKVRTGDSVLLRISSVRDRVPLVAYDLTGKTIVIEPLYTPAGQSDVTRDVSLRLSSLLQAAGAKTYITREDGQEAVTAQEFLSRAQVANPDIHIILDLSTSAKARLRVQGVTKAAAGETTLAQLCYQQLSKVQKDATLSQRYLDTAAPQSRTVMIGLGQVGSSENKVLYEDARWKDSVARSIYLAIGKKLTKR